MGCDYPLKGFRPPGGGKLVFNGAKGIQNTGALQVPCGNCMGCSIRKAGDWSTRMYNESLCWDRNCFVNLTIAPEHLLAHNSIMVRSFQLFMMRLRRRLGDRHIRFYACGEYGDRSGRPHYHAIIYNWSPDDQVFHFTNKHGDKLYTSAFLDDVWGWGQCTVGEVTLKSCGYTARYVTKKIRGSDQFHKDHYRRCSPIDGKMYDVLPEFALMSMRPGIGDNFAKKYKSDYYPSGFITVDGQKRPVPQYYLDKLTDEERKVLKFARLRQKVQPRSERTMERKVAREGVRNSRVKGILKRDEL